jgi:hypothetical protein
MFTTYVKVLPTQQHIGAQEYFTQSQQVITGCLKIVEQGSSLKLERDYNHPRTPTHEQKLALSNDGWKAI